MKTKTVEIEDKDGVKVPADLIICPECGGAFFHVYVFQGQHLHFQCEDCEASFCDGTCATIGN